MAKETSLSGKKILITSGPTRGPIDRVRYVTNKSTGRLGVFLAEAALKSGAAVTFIFGKGSLIPASEKLPSGERTQLRCIEIETVFEAKQVLEKELTNHHYDAVFHAMAVLDYVPETASDDKIPSGKDELVVRLVKTPKLISLVKELSPRTLLVGFKLEVNADRDRLIEAARALMERSPCDLVVANNLAPIEAGRQHVAYLVDESGASDAIVGKEAIADEIVQRVVKLLA